MRGTDVIDLRPVSTGSSGLSQTIINIIEQNTGTQVNKQVLTTDMEWSGEQLVGVKKWTDSARIELVYDIIITWNSGVPTQVVSTNLDDNIITTTTLTWSSGKLMSVNKVVS